MIRKRIKIILWLLVIIVALITVSLFKNTLALFETNAYGVSNSDIGRWIIRLSDELITSELTEDIVIDNFVYEQNARVASGVIAPGGQGYFELVFDATDCDVAVKYDIELRFSEMTYADNISFEVVSSDEDVVRTAASTYSGIISLAAIANEETQTITVRIVWDDDGNHDEDDTELGIVEDNVLSIPITVRAVQYLGETLVPYVEPEPEEPEEP